MWETAWKSEHNAVCRIEHYHKHGEKKKKNKRINGFADNGGERRAVDRRLWYITGHCAARESTIGERESVCVCVSGIHSTKPVLNTNAMSYCDTAGGFGEIRWNQIWTTFPVRHVGPLGCCGSSEDVQTSKTSPQDLSAVNSILLSHPSFRCSTYIIYASFHFQVEMWRT